jgi:hypothetical protein
LEILGLKGDFESAIKEFLDFRIGFQDGDVPEHALSRPTHTAIRRYEGVLKRNLDGLIGRRGAFEVTSYIDQRAGIGAVAAQFRPKEYLSPKVSTQVSLCQAAIATYEASSANSFSDSLNANYDARTSSVTFVKPLEFFRWTIDSAFADSRQMMNAFAAETQQ